MKNLPEQHSAQQHYELLSALRPIEGLMGALQCKTRADQLKKYEEFWKALIRETKGHPGVL